MRILASADLHGKQAVYEWLVRTAPGNQVEAVILGGDLLGCPDGFNTPEAAQEHEAQGLSEFLASIGLPVLYIMGNDDLVELHAPCERVQFNVASAGRKRAMILNLETGTSDSPRAIVGA